MSEHTGDTMGAARLAQLGWQDFFADQCEGDARPPVRVTAVTRAGLQVMGADIDTVLPPNRDVAVGDWLLFDAERPAHSARLDRKSLMKRKAAGRITYEQLIAANIDTAFIVTSCNADFNVARIERFIALVLDAGVTPVIVLTKPDLAEAPLRYEAEAIAISPLAEVVMLDARGDAPKTALAKWCAPGQTIAFLGSSGVGKSTLTNALAGTDVVTQDIREDDARGRHTTTHREIHLVPNGPAILDTPGMRELQLTDVAGGISELFEDIEEIAATCKFRDCKHEGEPGCAVRAALDDGRLDQARFERWRKLKAEDEANTETVHEKRKREARFSKMVKDSVRGKGKRR